MKAPKVIRKHVSIQASEMTEKRVMSRYKKWQLIIAKWIGVEVADNYQYLFRVDYKGNVRLRSNDIICNEQGVIFLVLKENNRLAMLVSKDASKDVPKMYGKLTILSKLEDENKK
jgi:hypothetical protein